MQQVNFTLGQYDMARGGPQDAVGIAYLRDGKHPPSVLFSPAIL